MHKIKIKKRFRKYTYEFPEDWSELNSSDFTAVYRYINNEIKANELIACMLRGKLKHLKNVSIAYYEEAFLPLLDFITKPPKKKWYFDELKTKKKVLAGPSSNYGTILSGEFAFADTYFSNFQESFNEDYLDKCIASLMREKRKEKSIDTDYKGDFREKFNENLINKRAEEIKHLPTWTKFAFMWNYRIFREFLEKKYIWVFSGSKKEESCGWDGVLRGMCKGDLTKMDDVANIPLFLFLDELNDITHENSK